MSYPEIIQIAEIHENKILMAIEHIKHLFPLNEKTIIHISENDSAWIELLISRFSKLQDLLGSKLIDIFLIQNKEDIDKFTMLDKLHKLERLEIIESTELWQEIRNIRNHVAQEYPNAPELAAKYLNRIFTLTPELLQIFNTIKEKIH